MMPADTEPLPLPEFFEQANAHRWNYRPNPQALLGSAAEWRRRHGIAPAAAATEKVHLLVIDAQKDFCFPAGSLYVGGRSGTGAMDDNHRLAEFIYHNLGTITAITTTLDTHMATQIFFPSFWVDSSGAPPSPHTVVSAERIRSGALQPNPAIADWLCGGDYPWLVAQAAFYCDELARAGKYELYLWPYHCLLGSDGHALAGIVQEAQLFHAFARQTQAWIEMKGSHVLTENYSILRPEVVRGHDGGTLAQKNTALLATLLGAEVIVIAGQAASHCVKSTIDDLLTEIRAVDPSLAGKVYILEDCMSSVVVPDGKGGFLADFTDQATAALDRFRNAGMHVVASTLPMADWPRRPLS
ncbi:MAG TPA: nicotinamidase [Chloroflexota bacterium]|nr:nicotinamidase [Chloroflexota bacterium]